MDPCHHLLITLMGKNKLSWPHKYVHHKHNAFLAHSQHSIEIVYRIGACKLLLYSNIKKCTLLISIPKVPGYYIKPNTIFLISCCILQKFMIRSLKSRLNTNIQTNFSKETSSEISYFITANSWKAVTRTIESVFNIKQFTTQTRQWKTS